MRKWGPLKMPILHSTRRQGASGTRMRYWLFSMVKEEELLRATEEIQNLTYRQGEYKIFKVFEPKERLIMALPFYDRVVQHMICNAIQPVFENGFYYHSYACRSGKGMHAASDTLYQWMYETEVKQGLRMYAF